MERFSNIIVILGAMFYNVPYYSPGREVRNMIGAFNRTVRSSAVIILALLSIALAFIGCSGGANSVTPDNTFSGCLQQAEETSNRVLWGYYLMYLNEDHTSLTVLPSRGTTWHLNALGIIEQYNPKAVTILNTYTHSDGTITASVSMKHPMENMPKYTAFDIRGIMMLPAKYYFPMTKVKLPGLKLGEAALLNADGYTRRWNPSEFSSAVSPFNYFDGKLIPEGMGILANATVNPYRCFFTNPNRRYFESGKEDVRHYHVSFPPGKQVFGYAVDASWGEPTSNIGSDGQPTKIPQSFQLTANSIEPYNITLSSTQSELVCSIGIYASGSMNLTIKVEDWNKGAYVPFDKVKIEAPDLFDGIKNPWTGSGNDYSYAYQIVLPNTKQVFPGKYPVLFSMEVPDVDNTFVPGFPLTAYQVFWAEVKEINPPFCSSLKGIHNLFAGSGNLNGTPGALHMDCAFLPAKVGGTGGLIFDGGIVGGNQHIQVAAIPGTGGNTTANTLFQRKGIDAGRALVVQTNSFNGHIILVNDSDADNMLIFNATGTLLKNYDLGDGQDGLNEPVALVANPSNGDIWLIGHKGNQGIHLERWAYVEGEYGFFQYIADPASTVDLSTYLGSNPKPLGIAVNGLWEMLYVFHARNKGSIEVFDISLVPPVRLDKWSRSNVIGLDVTPTNVSGLRKLIGGDIVIDHADGEDLAKCRILVFANVPDIGSRLVRVDGWCQYLNQSNLGSPFACMAINNLPNVLDRCLVLFPVVPSVNYLTFLAPVSNW